MCSGQRMSQPHPVTAKSSLGVWFVGEMSSQVTQNPCCWSQMQVDHPLTEEGVAQAKHLRSLSAFAPLLWKLGVSPGFAGFHFRRHITTPARHYIPGVRESVDDDKLGSAKNPVFNGGKWEFSSIFIRDLYQPSPSIENSVWAGPKL